MELPRTLRDRAMRDARPARSRSSGMIADGTTRYYMKSINPITLWFNIVLCVLYLLFGFLLVAGLVAIYYITGHARGDDVILLFFILVSMALVSGAILFTHKRKLSHK